MLGRLSVTKTLRSPALRALSTGSTGKLHELRQYCLHADDMPKYLALTGSDAFKARTDASPLLGFFVGETGGTLNRVFHVWEYDDLNHRTAVRKQLGGDKGFLDYFAQVWPVSVLAKYNVKHARPLYFARCQDVPSRSSPGAQYRSRPGLGLRRFPALVASTRACY